MRTQPDFDRFREIYDSGCPQVVWTTLVADLETPVSAMLKLADGRANAFLLESVEGGAVRGRYSVIGMKPDLIWRFYKQKAEINREARIDPHVFDPVEAEPLDSLRALIAESRIELPEGLPPMAAGLFGYMGYDAIRLFENIPDHNPDTLDIWDGLFLRPTVVCIFDRLEDVMTAVTPVRPRPDVSAAAAWGDARVRLADLVADFERSLPYRREGGTAVEPLPEPESNTGRDAYHAMVRKAVEYINAGDAFQVVPSHRLAVPFQLPPFALYRSLRRLNPSPFLFFFDFGGYSVVGSSPEILVRLRDGVVTIRPLAGTRRRGATPEEDRALAAELLGDPKERAEHLMLLDLGRNDVGRVSEIGSVSVKEQFTVEQYSHVCTSPAMSKAAWPKATMLSTRCSPVFRPGPSRARRRCGQWRSSTSWRFRVAASTPGRSVTSRPMAGWTPASRCEPHWSRMARCTCRPAAAWSPTVILSRSGRKPSTRPAPWCAPPRKRSGSRPPPSAVSRDGSRPRRGCRRGHGRRPS